MQPHRIAAAELPLDLFCPGNLKQGPKFCSVVESLCTHPHTCQDCCLFMLDSEYHTTSTSVPRDKQEQWLSSFMETTARKVLPKAQSIHIKLPEKESFSFSQLYEHFSVKSGSWFCQRSPVCTLRWLSCHVPLQMWIYHQVCIMQQVKKMHLSTRQKNWDVQVMNAKEIKDRYSVIAFRLHRSLSLSPL